MALERILKCLENVSDQLMVFIITSVCVCVCLGDTDEQRQPVISGHL